MYPLEGMRYGKLRPRDQSKPPSRPYLVALCLFPVLATCLVLWAVLQTWRLQPSPSPYHHHHQHSTQTNPWTTCGSSPTEAQSRGCRFDILSFAWQTPECYDGELMQDFIHYDNNNNTWQFYAHPNRTDVVVDLATALEGQRTLYVDWKYHITHCTFMWRQMHRAYALRGYIDGHLDSYEHTLHCQWVLTERDTPLGMVNVVAELKYPECRRIVIGRGGWKPRGGEGAFAGKGHHDVHGNHTL
ncbi:hypothetical protein C8A00DRAFT_28686 [Chaetomidium leptoderma]|uniref:Uncharacterized protein n=1 Tax=Chaetomidium leptoderma TaxID=669021 RepID=A0AAN7A2W3_9PEZI|nr:hypothetical protein C8A00DRAFT_28686 [Chaetomidium leptoderma]